MEEGASLEGGAGSVPDPREAPEGAPAGTMPAIGAREVGSGTVAPADANEDEGHVPSANELPVHLPVSGRAEPMLSVSVSPADPSNESDVYVFLCAACMHPLASQADVVQERAAAVSKGEVYAYQLDLDDSIPPLWMYSAMNPAQRRFDLMRIKGRICTLTKQVSCTTRYTSKDSFFPGYAWSFASCVNCGAFVGWGFRRQQEKQTTVAAHVVKACDDGSTSTRRADPNRIADPCERCGATVSPALHENISPRLHHGRESPSSPPADTVAMEAHDEQGSNAPPIASNPSSSNDGGEEEDEYMGPMDTIFAQGNTAEGPEFIGVIFTCVTGTRWSGALSYDEHVESHQALAETLAEKLQVKRRLYSLLGGLSLRTVVQYGLYPPPTDIEGMRNHIAIIERIGRNETSTEEGAAAAAEAIEVGQEEDIEGGSVAVGSSRSNSTISATSSLHSHSTDSGSETAES